MSQTYYNTNNETGTVLLKSEAKARCQDDVVLDYFIKHPYDKLSPDQVHSRCFSALVPLTSVRRSMSNLTDLGYLEKLPETVIGTYGKQVHVWQYIKSTNQLKMFS